MKNQDRGERRRMVWRNEERGEKKRMQDNFGSIECLELWEKEKTLNKISTRMVT